MAWWGVVLIGVACLVVGAIVGAWWLMCQFMD